MKGTYQGEPSISVQSSINANPTGGTSPQNRDNKSTLDAALSSVFAQFDQQRLAANNSGVNYGL